MMLKKSFDERRDLAIAGDEEEAVRFAAEHWVQIAREAIRIRSRFCVALSGGSTPNAIYKKLSTYATRLDWSKVIVFWSDERAVAPDHPDSNYFRAMESGLSRLPLRHVFRMPAEAEDLEAKATAYERLIQEQVGVRLFDLVMLGLGEDGHTASLFPHTQALTVQKNLVAANYIPEKTSWRMTFTYPCINRSRLAVLYAMGPSKSAIVKEVLHSPLPSPYPASLVGTPEHKALWILDQAAASCLN